MNLTENIKLALRVIRSNLLRSILTVGIIMFGITALIGILTATEGIRNKMISSFTEMGSNTFTIRSEGSVRRQGGPHRHRKAENPAITLQQVGQFNENYHYPAVISASCQAIGNALIVHESKKTNPNINVIGVDDNYLKVSGTNIAEGRNFSKTEIESGSNVVLLGRDIVAKIFEPYDTAVGQMISVGSKKYKVIGILASKGSSQMSSDNQAMIPLLNARYSFPSDNTSYALSVMVTDPTQLDLAIDEATGVLRGIRRLRLNDENDFDIGKSERLADQVFSQLKYVKIATIVIGILTLIGAGIGLMNIMLVSVNERTREIGISKALGATRRVIRIQFLTEAIVICQIGGMLGIAVGVGLGNLVGIFLKTGFIFPTGWVLAGIGFTFIVGLAAGYYPADRAAELDPVEALRYE